ncbi:MAG TPA: FlgD immunoglobulin-like domain containing protein [bacterium]|nr:FlgD immunoglobulin-like domain containing protein [bacterium]
MKTAVGLLRIVGVGVGVLAVAAGLGYAAAPDSLWMRAYGDSAQQQCRCIIETSDHGYALTGFTTVTSPGGVKNTDVYVVRLDPNGNVKWSRNYGGFGDDVGYGVRQTADGGFVVAGSYGYPADPNNKDLYLIKLDSLGTKQWERMYSAMGYDEAFDVQLVGNDAGFILVGYTQSVVPVNSDVYVVRTNSVGDTLYTRRYDFTINDKGYSICAVRGGGYVLCGHVQGSQSYDVLILKISAQLDSLWSKTYGGSGTDIAYSIKALSDGGLILAGERAVVETGTHNAWALRTNSTGDTLWTRTMTDAVVTRFFSVDRTSDGEYVFAGQYDAGSLASRDFYVVKLTGTGAVDWQTRYGTPTEDVALSVAQIFSGDYIIGGYTGLSGSGSQDVLVVKTGAMAGVSREAPIGSSQGCVPVLTTYPNPTACSATVGFDLGVGCQANVGIYDVAGKLVARVFSGKLAAGRQAFQWDGRDLDGVVVSPGVYWCKLQAGGEEAVKKVIVAR